MDDDFYWTAESLTPETAPIAMHAVALEARVAPGGPATTPCGGFGFTREPKRLSLPLPFVPGTSRSLIEEIVANPALQVRIVA